MKKIFIFMALMSSIFLASCSASQDEKDNSAIEDHQNSQIAQSDREDFQSNRNAQSESNRQVNQGIQDDQGSAHYLEVEELGFKIPLEATMAEDLDYQIDESEQGALFGSSSLTTLNENCEYGSLGNISKIGGTPSDPEIEAFIPQFYENSPTKQFDGFFLVFVSPQDSCTGGIHGDPEEFDVEKKTSKALKEGFQKAELMD